jgi:hypothetical protein
MHLSLRPTFANVVSSVALFTALSGGAYAAVQTGGINISQAEQKPTIDACVDSYGALKYTNDGTCPQGTALLSWNKQGPQGLQGKKGAEGPEGAKGAAGPQGPQGPAGPSFIRARYANNVATTTDWTTVAKVVGVPKGLYRVSAKAYAEMGGELVGKSMWARYDCRIKIVAGPGAPKVADFTSAEISDDGPEWASLALEGLAATDSDQGTFILECKDDGLLGGSGSSLHKAKIFVQEVGGWTATSM